MIRAARLLVFIALAPLLLAADSDSLELPAKSSRAKTYRKRGEAAYGEAASVVKAVEKGGELPSAEVMRAAMASLETAATQFERSIETEWNGATNDRLADVVRGWYALREKTPPPPPPEDPVALKKFEKARTTARKARLREARRTLVEALSARRHDKQVVRCDRCGGRGEMSSGFGQKYPCPKCGGAKLHRSRQGIIEAHFLPFSPLWRADPRNEIAAVRLLRGAARRPEKLGPFIRSVTVRGKIEDHDYWVRIHTKEKQYTRPGQQSTETVEMTYVLYRVGKNWWIHDGRADRKLFELPEGAD